MKGNNVDLLWSTIKNGDVVESNIELENGSNLTVKIYPVIPRTGNIGQNLMLGSTPVLFQQGTFFKAFVFIGHPYYKGKNLIVDRQTMEDWVRTSRNVGEFFFNVMSCAAVRHRGFHGLIKGHYQEVIKNTNKIEWGIA